MTSQQAEHESADAYVGEQVHQLLWRRKMSQQELGELLAVDQSTVSKKLRGMRSWTLDELLLVSRKLQVSVADLLPGEDYSPVVSGRGRVGIPPTHRYFGNVTDLTPFIEHRARRDAGLPGAGLPGAPAKVFAIRRRVVWHSDEQAS